MLLRGSSFGDVVSRGYRTAFCSPLFAQGLLQGLRAFALSFAAHDSPSQVRGCRVRCVRFAQSLSSHKPQTLVECGFITFVSDSTRVRMLLLHGSSLGILSHGGTTLCTALFAQGLRQGLHQFAWDLATRASLVSGMQAASVWPIRGPAQASDC